MLDVVFILILCFLLLPLTYLTVLALGASKGAPSWKKIQVKQKRKFVIAIAAHNEAAVIEKSIRNFCALDYPQDLFTVMLVADHCSDATASLAEKAGAVVYQRDSGPRSGKGAALAWLFDQIWQAKIDVDAIAIFDADTMVDGQFLQVMNARLESGEKVIQGQHIISNPNAGWFPMLTWAMFIIDNRYQNLGRVNLGWSAKHMGDTICFRAEILKGVGFGLGLTDDYEIRQKLLLMGIRIYYEPAAIGYGEAPKTWSLAVRQRSRWLRGVSDANKNYAAELLRQGVRQRNGAMIDGVLQSSLPSYSTLMLVTVVTLVIEVLVKIFTSIWVPWWLIGITAAEAVLLTIYPYWGLVLERAPLKAYLVLMTGPVYVFWRSWLAFKSRFLDKSVVWIRTPHGNS